MKVSVLGAGAIGSTFGGLLQDRDPGSEVLLLARGDHGEAMKRQCHVKLKGPWGMREVPIAVSGDPAELAGSDVVLITVKSQATREAIERAAPHLGDAVVVSLQNGVNQRTLNEFVAADRLLIGMTTVNAAILEPGTVTVPRPGPTMIGSVAEQAAPRVDRVVDLLRKTGLKIEPTSNILGVQYNKIALNTIGYASVLSASNFLPEAVLHGPWRKAVGLPVLDETLDVLQRSGVELARTPGITDVFRFSRLMRVFETPVLGASWAAIGRMFTAKKPIVFSLELDLRRGKPTEIDYVNGEIVRLAGEHGLAAPRNALAVKMVRELEARGDGTFFTREEVVSRFGALQG